MISQKAEMESTEQNFVTDKEEPQSLTITVFLQVCGGKLRPRKHPAFAGVSGHNQASRMGLHAVARMRRGGFGGTAAFEHFTE